MQMGDVYALSPFLPISIVKSVQGGGGFSSGHKWGILGGRQGPAELKHSIFRIESDFSSDFCISLNNPHTEFNFLKPQQSGYH